MKVIVPRIAEHAGYPGNAIEIEIFDYCPICGGKRGEPHKVISWDGSRRLEVDGWINPCGHIDKYCNVRKEAESIKDTNHPDYDPTKTENNFTN